MPLAVRKRKRLSSYPMWAKSIFTLKIYTSMMTLVRSVSNAITSALIPPNGQAQFAVTFAPQTAANNRGYALIESDDP